jgi:peptidoglycan glycosyltransferase
MEKRIRVLGLIFMGLFALLFVQLNNWQVKRATSYKAPVQPKNVVAADQFIQARGMILTSDFNIIARSVRVGKLWMRTYPQGRLFADITGYFDVTAHAAPLGIEGQYNNFLASHMTPVHTYSDLFSQHEETNDVVLTLSAKLQAAAQSALAGQDGAVVAIDPRTGAVLAMYGNPTYDPNPFSTYSAKQATAYYNSLNPNSGSSPLVNVATDELHPPGSTFKVIDSAAIFDHDPALATKVWKPENKITIPGTGHPGQPLQNFGASYCPPNGPAELPELLTASCDITFGRIGLALGATNVVDEARAFGFDSTPPLDLPADVAAAQIPAPLQISYPGALAISAIGQYEDAATALEMAEVSAAVANGGVIMTPHLLDHVLNQQGQVVDTYKPHAWRTATSAATAAQVAQLMLGPTNDYNNTSNGTLSGVLNAANLGGIYVGGKTGTAENTSSPNGCGNIDWVTAWGPALTPTPPTIAVAAWVKPPPTACSATGAEYAGPVVQAMLRTYFGV